VFSALRDDIVVPIWENNIKPALDQFMDWLANEIPYAAGELRRIVEEQFNNVKDAIELAWSGEYGIKFHLDNFISFLATEIPRAAEGLRNILDGVFNAISGFIQGAIDKLQAFLNLFTGSAMAEVNAAIPGGATPRPLQQGQYIVPNQDRTAFVRGTYQAPKTYQFRAGGGAVSGGLDYLVGEKGPEFLRLPPGMNGWIDSNSILKNKLMMEGILGNTLPGNVPYPTMPSANNSWQDDHSVNYGDINFNGVRSSDAAVRRFSMLRMLRR
jgi:hypothetical protein